MTRTPLPYWPLNVRPSVRRFVMFASMPASSTALSRAIGTPDTWNDVPPFANVNADDGVTLPNACRQPTVPRAVNVPLAIEPSCDAARTPRVEKPTCVVSPPARSAAAPPVSV